MSEDYGAIAEYLRAAADLEADDSQAEKLAGERLRQEREREEIAAFVEGQLGRKAPQGYSNRPKALEISRFIERKGFTTPEAMKKKLGDLQLQARQAIQMPGISELDRVWLALHRGILR